jgi:hypothetical protein
MQSHVVLSGVEIVVLDGDTNDDDDALEHTPCIRDDDSAAHPRVERPAVGAVRAPHNSPCLVRDGVECQGGEGIGQKKQSTKSGAKQNGER